MDYSLLAKLISWIFPTKESRKAFRKICNEIEDDKKIPLVQEHYQKILQKLNEKKQKKIKVLFLVSECSKWHAQSLYDLMACSNLFEPVIALTLLTDVHKGFDNTRNDINENYQHFKAKGMNVVLAYQNNNYINLKDLGADVVFYQQPWGISKIQSPQYVSNFALTYYIPYYLPNYGVLDLDINLKFHKYLYKYYVLNKEWASFYGENSKVQNFCSVGHPQLDDYKNMQTSANSKNYIIYAPHYSIKHPLNDNPVDLSTFLDNGSLILDYAKKHSNLNWVFKPHPQLKYALLKIGLDENWVNNYYSEWEKLGTACYTDDYKNLFLNSKALITDSASFLIEYFCTGKPIIHLINFDSKVSPSIKSMKILDTLYKSYNNDEMLKIFNNILVNDNDYKKQEREDVLKKSQLIQNNASENIMKDLMQDLKGEVK